MSEVVISEFMDEAEVEFLKQRFDVVYDPELVQQPDRLAALLDGARALIVRNRTQVRGSLLEAGQHLRVVGRLGVGLDNIDMQACSERGIRVIPASGANNIAVAEYVIAAMLYLIRGVFNSNAAMLAGQWPRNQLMGGEVYGRTLGLVGFGGIAREVAARAGPLGLNLLAFDPALKDGDPEAQRLAVTQARSLDALLQASDVVSLHVPFTPHTRHLINAECLAAMRPHAVLINAARGGVVDDTALAAALRGQQIAGAALDVFETEPMPADSVFRNVPNLLLTPHIGGVTHESNKRVSRMIAQSVASELEASP